MGGEGRLIFFVSILERSVISVIRGEGKLFEKEKLFRRCYVYNMYKPTFRIACKRI